MLSRVMAILYGYVVNLRGVVHKGSGNGGVSGVSSLEDDVMKNDPSEDCTNTPGEDVTVRGNRAKARGRALPPICSVGNCRIPTVNLRLAGTLATHRVFPFGLLPPRRNKYNWV